MTSGDAPTLVGVSVVNYRCADATVGFVRSAIERRGDAELRICCVDNSDDPVEFARLKSALEGLACPGVDVTVVDAQANLGYGAGHARAAAWLLAQEVAVMLVANPDVVVRSGSLGEFADQVQASPVTIFGAPTVEDGVEYSGTSVLDPWTSRSRHVTRAEHVPGGVHFVNGHFLAMTADRWRALGGFADPYFLYFEEADLSMRARRDGGTIGTARKMLIEHQRGLSTNPDRSAEKLKSRTTIYHSTCSAVIFTALHFPRRLPAVLAARLVYGLALRIDDPQALRTVLAAVRRGLAVAFAGVVQR